MHVEQEPELPLDRVRGIVEAVLPVSQPIGPLGDHRIAHLGDDATGDEQCGLGSTHYAFSLVKVRQFTAGISWGQNHWFGLPMTGSGQSSRAGCAGRPATGEG